MKDGLEIIGGKFDSKTGYLTTFKEIRSYRDGDLVGSIKLTKKQLLAWKVLTDNKREELLFGGAVGGGKSFVGSLWIIMDSLLNSDVRYLIGRRQLSDLYDTTLKTFNEVLNLLGLVEGIDYKSNQQLKVYTFKNGSEVVYRDLQQQPRDPLYNRLGGLELTGYFLDEAQEISRQAVKVLRTRLRRIEKRDNTGTLVWSKVGKSLYSCNPGKNFVYTDFYLPKKKGVLTKTKEFIFSGIKDNPHLPKVYVDSILKLRHTDPHEYERLVMGNFDYDNDPSLLFNYDDLVQLFYTKLDVYEEESFMSVDLSGKGADKTIIMIWKGLQIVSIHEEQITDWKTLIPRLELYEKKYNIKRKNVVIDSDGLGENFIDFYPNYYRFKGGSSYIKEHVYNKDDERFLTRYKNLRSQCYFKVGELVKDGLVGMNKELETHQEAITTELGFVKEVVNDTGVKQIIPKKEIIENLGHSPDYADAIMMRMVYELERNDGNYTIAF